MKNNYENYRVVRCGSLYHLFEVLSESGITYKIVPGSWYSCDIHKDVTNSVNWVPRYMKVLEKRHISEQYPVGETAKNLINILKLP